MSSYPQQMRGPPPGMTMGGGNSKETQLMLHRLHANSHQTTFIGAWLLGGFAILTIIVSIFLMIGVWQSNSNKTDIFQTYCYAIWGVLSGGLALVIGFLIYFHWNMKNLWKKGRSNIDLAFDSDPYGDRKKVDPATKKIRDAEAKFRLEQINAQAERLKTNQRTVATGAPQFRGAS